MALERSLELAISSREGRAQPMIFLRHANLSLSRLFICCGASSVPHSHTVHKDALNEGAVEEHQQLFRQIGLFEEPQEVQALLCFLYSSRGVISPGESVRDEGSQKFQCVNPLHPVSIDGQRMRISSALPEVCDQDACHRHTHTTTHIR